MAANPLDASGLGAQIPDPPPGTIAIKGGSLCTNADDAENALIEAGAEIYQHGTRLVRVGAHTGNGGVVKREAGAPMLHEVNEAWLRDELTRQTPWVKFDKRAMEWIPTNAPRDVAQTLLARAGAWPFERLAGFIETPILLPDGRVLENKGFDQNSGLYLVRNGLDIAPIPDKPSKEAATEAVETLYQAVETFPFLTDSDQSAIVAAMCQGVLRRSLPSAPLVVINASTPAIGKTLLAHVISTLCTGRKAAAMALGRDQAETEKRLDATLLTADPLVLLDNISFVLSSDALCIIATESEKAVRVLGSSTRVMAPTNSTFILTGNNITLLRDLTRRVLMIRMDAGCERPELRPIPRDALEYIRTHRAALVRAVLVLSKAYLAADCPDVKTAAFGSFEGWDRMIRRPLVWVGMADPLEATEDLREEDHEFVGMRDLMGAWWGLWKDRPVTAREIIEAARAGSPQFSGGFEQDNPDLSEAVAAIVGDGSREPARELGYRLRAWQGRIIAGYRLVRERKRASGVAFYIKPSKTRRPGQQFTTRKPNEKHRNPPKDQAPALGRKDHRRLWRQRPGHRRSRAAAPAGQSRLHAWGMGRADRKNHRQAYAAVLVHHRVPNKGNRR